MSNAIRELEVGSWRVRVREDWSARVAEAFDALGLRDAIDLDALALEAAPASGRSQARVLVLDEGVRLQVRPFAHGGVLAPWTGKRFANPARFERELRTHAALFDRGLPLPEPVFALWRKRGAFHQGAYATRLIEDAQDGVAFLEQEPSEREVDGATRAAARAIRAFHDAGALHGDLHLKNLLFRDRFPGRDPGDAPECWLVDLDRSVLAGDATARARMRELMRLLRSLRKRGHRSLVTAERERLFLDAYCNGDHALRSALVAHRHRERFRTELHALFYPRMAR